jgi:signal transduction histidine kinase
MHQDVFRAIGAAQSQRVRELGNARAELQQALVRFTELQEEERGAIAQALHDETIQALLATLWALEELEPSTDVVDRIRRNLEAAVTAARSMLRDLRPPALDELGVVAAVEQELQRLAEETGIAVSFDGAVGGRLPTHVETLTFRTAQEVLRNVRQHGSASSVQVRMERRDEVLYVEVQDDGIGVDPALPSADSRPHAGIVAMRENIVMGGGSFSIGPRPGQGTVVRFSLPGQ